MRRGVAVQATVGQPPLTGDRRGEEQPVLAEQFIHGPHVAVATPPRREVLIDRHVEPDAEELLGRDVELVHVLVDPPTPERGDVLSRRHREPVEVGVTVGKETLGVSPLDRRVR